MNFLHLGGVMEYWFNYIKIVMHQSSNNYPLSIDLMLESHSSCTGTTQLPLNICHHDMSP